MICGSLTILQKTKSLEKTRAKNVEDSSNKFLKSLNMESTFSKEHEFEI